MTGAHAEAAANAAAKIIFFIGVTYSAEPHGWTVSVERFTYLRVILVSGVLTGCLESFLSILSRLDVADIFIIIWLAYHIFSSNRDAF